MRILLGSGGIATEERMPYGFRITGADGAEVSTRTMRLTDRALRRIRTVAGRLDESLTLQ